MQEELRRQEAARRAFVATASHELRTPLTIAPGHDRAARGGPARRPPRHRTTPSSRSPAPSASCGASARLATELLDLSRLDAAVPLRSEPVELGELCRAVAAEFELRARDRGVEIDVEPAARPVLGAAATRAPSRASCGS